MRLSGGPGARDFAFLDQIHRSGLSIMNNVAEGFERSSDPDFARFLDIAKGSCAEVRSLYHVAEDLEYIAAADADAARTATRRLAAGIASMSAYLRTATRR